MLPNVSKKRLSIEEGILKNHSVSFGKIKCHCGVTMVIEEGILLTSEIINKDIDPEKKTKIQLEIFLRIHHTLLSNKCFIMLKK